MIDLSWQDRGRIMITYFNNSNDDYVVEQNMRGGMASKEERPPEGLWGNCTLLHMWCCIDIKHPIAMKLSSGKIDKETVFGVVENFCRGRAAEGRNSPKLGHFSLCKVWLGFNSSI